MYIISYFVLHIRTPHINRHIHTYTHLHNIILVQTQSAVTGSEFNRNLLMHHRAYSLHCKPDIWSTRRLVSNYKLKTSIYEFNEAQQCSTFPLSWPKIHSALRHIIKTHSARKLTFGAVYFQGIRGLVHQTTIVRWVWLSSSNQMKYTWLSLLSDHIVRPTHNCAKVHFLLKSKH